MKTILALISVNDEDNLFPSKQKWILDNNKRRKIRGSVVPKPSFQQTEGFNKLFLISVLNRQKFR